MFWVRKHFQQNFFKLVLVSGIPKYQFLHATCDNFPFVLYLIVLAKFGKNTYILYNQETLPKTSSRV